MPAPTPLPPRLTAGPFPRSALADVRLSPKVLLGDRFTRLLPNVWVHTAHPMSDLDHIRAACLAVPERARLTDAARLRVLGYDDLPLRPICFLTPDDHHADLDGVLVHRTSAMSPCDDVGVTPAAAFLECCADEALIDLVAAGDWLIRNDHTSPEEITELAEEQPWRPGARRVGEVLPLLDPRSRSPRESKLRALLVVAGLPKPEVNVDLVVRGRKLACVDLLFLPWLLVVEYEGRQHAEDDQQFNVDIDRYELLRRHEVPYLQVTDAKYRQPRALVQWVHQALVARGYDGPAPVFGAAWRGLFAPRVGAHTRRR